MMKKLQTFIRVGMNISKMSDMKITQDLKNLKVLKKVLKVYYEICEMFQKRTLEEVISSWN